MKELLVIGLLFFALQSCSQMNSTNDKPFAGDASPSPESTLDTAYFGAGCFWCVEAVFQELQGVYKVESGYMGGSTDNPTYKEICTGRTGHAEICKLTFNPEEITFDELLEVFWTTHDPTTLNRQGNDVGTQYRSAVFYRNEEQKVAAEKSKKEVGAPIWNDPIVTEITPASTYYPAEDYHQNYYKNNSNQGYCRVIINPKVQKVREKFADKLKP
jgi:peptide-methionine (S)-S-oxide reductase